MGTRELANSPKHSTADGQSREKSSAGGAACVEIVGFPQILYMRSFGDPDALFVLLLDSAREAYGTIDRLSTHGEDRSDALRLSGMQLATALLQRSGFTLGARGLPHEHAYTIDLTAGTLHLITQLYSVSSRRTSFFKVDIAGNISGGPFVVRNPVYGTVVMQVEEERLREPNFFASSLAQECVRSQMDEERFGRIDEIAVPEANGDLRMTVTLAGSKVAVVFRKKQEGGKWNIVDGRQQESVGTLSPDMERTLGSLAGFIQELLEKK